MFANECFALEGRKIANVGAEMLYTRILQTCVNNGISQNSFSELYKGNGEFYTYFFYPQNDNVIQTTLDYNNDGYVTLISIDGAGLDEQQRLTVYGMAVACLKALNITETEKAKNLAKDFANFYSSVYRVNDFSLSSVSSANTEESKKEILSKGLSKFQSLLNNDTAKNKKKQ